MEARDDIARFLAEGPWAVAGASNDRAKFGNKVLRSYLAAGKGPVYPLNPREENVEGQTAYADLAALPESVRALSIVTPPPITDRVVEEAIAQGVEYLWMQPGAESESAIEAARAQGLTVIAHGPCLLVELGFPD